MPQTIKLKRSATAGQVPTTGQLDLGELAINTNDGKMFLRKSDGTTDVVLEFNGSISGSNASMSTGTAAPTDPAPAEGNLWFDTANDVLMYYDGAAWQEVANTLTNLTVTGNTTLGNDAAADTLNITALTTITGTDGLTIPSGTTAQRNTANTGTIRYNTTTSSFEGFSGSSWGSLGGVKDVDQDTFITTETSAGSDEDTFTFQAAGSNIGTWNTTGLTVTTPATFNGNVTIQSGDTFTLDGIALKEVRKFNIYNSAGTIVNAFYVLDTDTTITN